MGKLCAIDSCSSGHYADVKRRKNVGVRQVSFFNVPKSLNTRLKWSEAVRQILADKDNLCELHFDEGDINKVDKTVLPDGTVHVIPRIRYSLVPGAVPVSTEIGDCILPEVVTGSMEIDEQQADVTIPDERNDCQGNLLPECTSNPHSEILQPDNTANVRGFADHLLDTNSEDSDTSDADGHIPEIRRFSIQSLIQHLSQHPLPETWSWMKSPREDNGVVLTQLDFATCKIRVHLDVHSDLCITLRTSDDKATTDTEICATSIREIEILLRRVERTDICSGTGIETDSRSRACMGIVDLDEYSRHVRVPRCTDCRNLRRNLQNRSNKKKTNLQTRYARSKRERDLKHRRYIRLQKRAERLRRKVCEAKEQCAAIEEQALTTAISELPPVQQEAVKACFSAAKVGNSRQRRYTVDWVYECVLMRIKNSKLYEHLRSRDILPLPTKDTINRYIRRLDSTYGFQNAVFECLLKKASNMEAVDRRGALLVDEMALSESIYLDRKTMQFHGFVDLGDHTTAEQQNIRGDHALVFMFQPFRGPWVQVLGCFLSKNAVISKVLHKLIIECILLLEGSEFYVDVVTSDGAQWNRGVWSILGIKDQNFSCEHPYDDTRRLWMISDFPHLWKCWRNGAMLRPLFRTHHGLVKKKHWEALLKYEGYTKPNLKIAFKLTPAHLNPKGYQKMNVPLAFELVSERVRIAMAMYKDDPKCPDLHDAAPTIELCKLGDDVISALMSRSPNTALRPIDSCKQKKAIKDFDTYLRDWERMTKEQHEFFPISPSTLNGFKITFGATLELLQYLHEKHNYDYLMTARLNQDALERFFGMMRNSCGSNDHPDPVLFIQVFRLLCSYSLVKPPRGSNVSGSELLGTLMETKESLAAAGNLKRMWTEKIDSIVEGQYDAQDGGPSTSTTRDHNYDSCTGSQFSEHHLLSHDYDVTTTSEEVQSYIAGFVARKMRRFTKCINCLETLESSDRCTRDRVIEEMDRFGGLITPSEQLFSLTKALEAAVLDVAGKLTVKINTLYQILDKVSELKNLTYVGCETHRKDLTQKVINYYLVMRGHFLAKSVNENNNERKNKSKMHRKNSKL